MRARIPHGDQRWPKELWGREVGEAMRYYNVMRQDFISRNQPGQPSAPAPQPVAPAAPAAPGYTPPMAVRGDSDGGEDAALDARVERVMRRVLGQSPMMHVAADSIKEKMRRTYPDFMQLEQQVLQELQALPNEMLADEGVWRSAYFLVRGRQGTEGYPAPAPVAPTPQPHSGWNQPTSAPIVTPPPPVYFAEASTAPSAVPGQGGPDPRNNPEVIRQAQRFQMSVDDYVSFMHGNVPPLPTNGNGR